MRQEHFEAVSILCIHHANDLNAPLTVVVRHIVPQQAVLSVALGPQPVGRHAWRFP